MPRVNDMKRILAAVCALLLAGRSRAAADVWDVASPGGDNDGGSHNELSHDAMQVHDLAALPGPVADEDWYRLMMGRASSYEVVLDGFSGELSLATTVDLVDGSGATIATAKPSGGGLAKTLAFENTNTVTSFGEFLRVHGAECGTACDANDQYTIRFRETTYAIPRFNNSGSQRTLLLLQAPHPVAVPSVSGHIYFWSTTGAGTTGPLAVQTFTLDSQASMVIDTSTIPGLAGQAGSITISHDGPYGVLAGKAVAVEPATGFTFDSPMEPRP